MSIAKRLRDKLAQIKQELRKRRDAELGETGRWLGRVLQGWMNYHAVPGNTVRLQQFSTVSVAHACNSFGDAASEAIGPGHECTPSYAGIFRNHASSNRILTSDFAPDLRQEPYEVLDVQDEFLFFLRQKLVRRRMDQ